MTRRESDGGLPPGPLFSDSIMHSAPRQDGADASEGQRWSLPQSCPIVLSLTGHPWEFVTVDGMQLATTPALTLQHKLGGLLQVQVGDGEVYKALTMADVLTTRITMERCQDVATFLAQWGCFDHPHPQDASFFAAAADIFTKLSDEEKREHGLYLRPTDFQDSEHFDAETAREAEGGEGGARHDPLSLLPLSDARFVSFVDHQARFPLFFVTLLQAMLQVPDREEARAMNGSDFHSTWEELVGMLSEHLHLTNPSSAVLARNLAPFMKVMRLPVVITSARGGADEYMSDLRDAVRCAGGAGSAVASQRIAYVALHLENFAIWLGLFPDPQQAEPFVHELRQGVLRNTPGSHQQPLYVVFQALDTYLGQVMPLMQSLVDAGKTGPEVSQALLLDAGVATSRLLGDMSGGTSDPSPGGGGGDGPTPAGMGGGLVAIGSLTPDAFDEAVHSGPFRTLVSSAEGVEGVDLWELIFLSGCVLALRFALRGETWLRAKIPTFSRAAEVLYLRRDFFSRCVAWDPAAGEVPELLRPFTMSAEETKKMVNFDFVNMDPVNAPDGFYGLKELVHATRYAPISRFTFLTTEVGLRAWGEQMTRRGVALGFPAHVDEEKGFTFETLAAFHISFMQYVLALPAAEQWAWKDFAYEQFQEVLRVISERASAIIMSSNPKEARLDCVIERGCAYKFRLQLRKESADKLVHMRQAFPSMFPARPVSVFGAHQGGAPPPSSDDPRKDGPRGDGSAGASAGRRDASGRGGGAGAGGAGPKSAKKGKKTRQPGAERSDAKKSKGAQPAFHDGGDRKSDEPGSKKHFAKWLTPNKELFLAGHVYDIQSLTSDLGVTVSSACWPVVLSTKEGKAALALCPACDKHGDIRAACHRRPQKLTPSLASQHARPATDAEKKAARWGFGKV